MSSFRHELTDAQWSRLETALPPWRRGPERKDDRLVINGIFLGVADRGAVARPPRAVRTVHDLLQSLQPLEQGWHMAQNHAVFTRQ